MEKQGTDGKFDQGWFRASRLKVGRVGGSNPSTPTVYQAPFLTGFFIMYTVYIIYSQKIDKYYIGFSSNVHERLPNTIEILKVFLLQENPGSCCILNLSIQKRMLWQEKINLKNGKTGNVWKL